MKNKLNWTDFDMGIRKIFDGGGIYLDTLSKTIPFATFTPSGVITYRQTIQLTALCIELDLNYILNSGLCYTFWHNSDLAVLAMRERSGTMTGRMSNE